MLDQDLYLYKGIISNVYDGDTMRVNIDLGFNTWIFDQKLRLAGIDTPEIRGEERPLGLEAKKYVTDRLPEGTEVFVMTEKDASGKYGRYLATIFYGDELNNLNEELLSSGLAEVYDG